MGITLLKNKHQYKEFKACYNNVPGTSAKGKYLKIRTKHSIITNSTLLLIIFHTLPSNPVYRIIQVNVFLQYTNSVIFII